jgi:hypothetical protein
MYPSGEYRSHLRRSPNLPATLEATPTVTQLLNYLPVGVLYNNLAVTKFIIVTASDGLSWPFFNF